MNQTDGDEAVRELHSIGDMLRWTVSNFNAAMLYYGHGTDNSCDEALRLVLPTVFLPPDLPQNMWSSRLTPTERQRIAARVMRRINERIPLAYLTSQAWFCGLEFYVDERVLIPRSPIGELIDKRFSPLLLHPPGHILDLCTGSGCIAVACAAAFPDAHVDAVDICSEALAVAEYNIQQHGAEQQVTPILSDLFCTLPAIKYDLIVTNPPYVDAEDMADLPQEFRFEPVLGLAAGSDGLGLVRRILASASDFLADDGLLICETGNSRVHLAEQYPAVPFTWLTFDKRGEGVFMLTRQQLQRCAHLFYQEDQANK